MGKFFEHATKLHSLRRAWFAIRSNGIRSPLHETRESIDSFERDADRHLFRIQRSLRNGTFSFEPQKGILKAKKNGKKRGIVMAPVQNRIVERAWLDCLQEQSPYVQKVIRTPTSVGGVPDRSVPHGLALIRNAFAEHKEYFVRADISGFFDHIPRRDVIAALANTIDDPPFLEILENATTVTLANEAALGEDRKIFPTDEVGVAQGSPLSPLFGNILLHDFDQKFNDRGIVCVRFIDDFVLLGERQAHVMMAFASAKKHLEDLDLKCHDPFDPQTPQDKAQHGSVESGFVFLGYDILPGLIQPSTDARKKFLMTIDRHVQRGRHAISQVLKSQNSFEQRQRYVQTLDLLDRVIRGWGNAFAYSNAKSTLNDLDGKINEKLQNFRAWYRHRMANVNWRDRRRAIGVGLLGDIRPKSLDDLPFRLEKRSAHRKTKDMITISTDGSVVGTGPRAGKDQGPGGWSAVVHNDGREICGHAVQVTNNQMELTAVIEALKHTPSGSRVIIRTDSQYVHRAAQEGAMIRSNTELWETFRELAGQRRVNVVWVPGHSDDEYNERADSLAREQAHLAREESEIR